MTLPPQLLEQLIAAVADSLAPRLADELAPRIVEWLAVPVTQPKVELWRLLTLAEAAERLGRSERWLRERKEQVGYVRLDGGALGFQLQDLQAYAAERIVGGRSPLERAV